MDNTSNIAKILKQRRIMTPLRLQELSTMSGVSPSHLGHVEEGERFPSALILRKIAKPLGFEESELLILGGYLSRQPSAAIDNSGSERLDPYVVAVLSHEPVEIQRAVGTILSIVNSMVKYLHS